MPSAGRPPEIVTCTPRMGFVRMGFVLTVLLAILTIPPVARAQPAPVNTAATVDEIAGNYRFPNGTIVGVSPFSSGGPLVPFFANYTTGVIRTLYPDGVDRFVMGPAFARQSPVEQRIRIIRDPSGAVIGVGLQPPGGPESVAQRVPESVEPVRFSSSDATLDGWLIKPAGPGPHPAIVLLHGSGPLTRTSFGPYPRYFASLGFAVLTYDKRGAGRSTGPLFPRTAFYPEPYVQDAQAALAFLVARSDIDPKQIGLWVRARAAC